MSRVVSRSQVSNEALFYLFTETKTTVYLPVRYTRGLGWRMHCGVEDGEGGHRRRRTGTGPRCRPPRHSNLPQHTPCQPQQDGGKGRCPVVSNRPLHSVMQQRCHHSSASARSPSSLTMPRLCLQRAATAQKEKFQIPEILFCNGDHEILFCNGDLKKKGEISCQCKRGDIKTM